MHIGIIGAGAIGGTLARKLVAAGHSVKLAGSKGADAVRETAVAVGAEPASAKDAAQGVDVIVLSVPFMAIPNLKDVFSGVPANVPVLDTGNYYPFRDGQIEELEAGKTESVWVNEQLGRATTKVFNTVSAHTFAENGAASGAASRMAIPVAGDDPEAKRVAQLLVDQAGFDAFDAGPIDQSWRLQPGTPVYCTELTLAELPDALATADKARAPVNRDRVVARLWGAGTTPTHEESVAACRAVADPNW